MNQTRTPGHGASDSDDADARGEHVYPDEPGQPNSCVPEQPEQPLVRDPGSYVAGADGTQQVTTPEEE